VIFDRTAKNDIIRLTCWVAATKQIIRRGGELAPGMVDAVLHQTLRVGGSSALAARAVPLLEAVQGGRARCPLAHLPAPLVGTLQCRQPSPACTERNAPCMRLVHSFRQAGTCEVQDLLCLPHSYNRGSKRLHPNARRHCSVRR